jgi:two-component system nitrogen regulation response regulator NtrX
MALLSTMAYRGNVRQLKNTIERLTILHPGRTIQPEHLEGSSAAGLPNAGEDVSLAEKMANYEKNLIAQTLESCDGNISEAARILGVNRANLSRKIKELSLKN